MTNLIEFLIIERTGVNKTQEQIILHVHVNLPQI